MPLDLSKPVQTRDGREVRIYATEGNSTYPIHGAMKKDGEWWVTSWLKDGSCYPKQSDNDPCDLINVPTPKRKVTFYVNVYENGCLSYSTKEMADRAWQWSRESKGINPLTESRIACIPVTVEYTEGEGLQ